MTQYYVWLNYKIYPYQNMLMCTRTRFTLVVVDVNMRFIWPRRYNQSQVNRLIIDNVQKAEAMALAEIPEGEIEFKKKTMLDLYREKEEVRFLLLQVLFYVHVFMLLFLTSALFIQHI